VAVVLVLFFKWLAAEPWIFSARLQVHRMVAMGIINTTHPLLAL